MTRNQFISVSHDLFCVESTHGGPYPQNVIISRSARCADSSQHVCIEDCYISVGDDAISIKSGWDQFGTSFAMPSKHIKVQRILAFSRSSAGISFGSEMSGGISDVKVSVCYSCNQNHLTLSSHHAIPSR